MLSSSSSIFDSLPTRPPTPPREISKAVDDAISFLDDGNEVERLISSVRPEAHIPDASNYSPYSSQGTTATSNTSKKVGFSPHPRYYKIAAVGQVSSPEARLLKRAPSAKDARPAKSILKFAEIPPPLTPDDFESKFSYFSPQVPGSFAKMLQSVIHQLAGPSRASRLDAYLALNGVLKAYDDFPDAQAMVQKMSIMMQFLTRDMSWKGADGNLDTNVVTQALKLAAAMLNDPKLAAAFDDDFRIFLLDRSIGIMEQVDASKQIIKAHMYLLIQQRFQSSIMTNDRADKLITALKSIEDRCSGNNVVMTRQMIYLRLLDQAPAAMLARIRDWLEHVFHGMLSSVSEVRTRAIETCTRAGLVFGSQPHAAKALCEMFDTEIEEGQTYCDYLTFRLLQMRDEKEDEASVPQIWSAVILFFRSKQRRLEYWGRFRSWLTIIEKCLNSSNLTTKYNAILAWDRLVFAIMPDSSTTKNMKSMLKVPIIQSMDKSGIDKFSKPVRRQWLDSYCNLLHYSVRPGLSNEEHDEAWDTYVGPILSQMVKHSGKPRHTACRIIHGLVSGSTGVWNVNAALENTPIKPEDLPKLDARWVRSRLGRLLKPLEPLLDANFSASTEANAALDVTWRSLMRSVGGAGSQEVKTSSDLKQATALLVNLFQRIWSACILAPEAAEKGSQLDRYVFFIEMTVASIGARVFAEDILSTTDNDGVEVAPTPSHRTSKRHMPPQSPLVILLGLFLRLPNGGTVNETCEAGAHTLIRCIASSRPILSSRLELLSRTFSQLSLEIIGPSLHAQSNLWTAFGRNAVRALQLDSSSSQDSQSLGHAMRHAVEILSTGLRWTASTESTEMLIQLHDAIHEVAKARTGDGGVILALTEPFAKELVTSANAVSFRTRIQLTTHVLQNAVWPKTRQSLEVARKALWDVGLTPHKANLFDPYDNLYKLIIDLMTAAYNGLGSPTGMELGSVVVFFSSTIAFLARSPASLLVTSLRKLQDGFALFIVDHDKKTGSNDDIANAVKDTWSALLKLLKSVQTKDSTLLKALEALLVAGFSSPHKPVVIETISFWNESFGAQQSLEYPSTLEKVLRAQALEADIDLPDFPQSNDDVVPASLPEFYDIQSQFAEDLLPSGSANSFLRKTSLQVPQPEPQSMWSSPLKTPLRQNRIAGPARRSVPFSSRSTPKARLRHDDSQIQFAPIESSPIPPADESQLLTERQREVTARQLENAQMFSELSSSPMAHSTPLPRIISKRLDFKVDAGQDEDEEAPGTPARLPDAAALMSDDMPSSPTPSSTKDASQGVRDVEDEQEPEQDSQDVPSSPPRVLEEILAEPNELGLVHAATGPDDSTVITDFDAEVGEDDVEPADVPNEGRDEAVLGPETRSENDANTFGFPSDSQLPTMQLQQEEEAAAFSHTPPVYASGFVNDSQAPLSQRAIESDNAKGRAASGIKATNAEAQTSDQDDVKDQDADQNDVTRVENSFIEPDVDSQSMNSQSNSQGQRSQRHSRKRRRRSSIVYTSKKQKQQSSFNRITSYIFGQSQDEDDDIGEEIVVASRQRSSPPPNNPTALAVRSPSQLDTDTSEPVGEAVGVVKTEPDAIAMPPPKRGRGRPRKSQTPTSSQADSAPGSSLKRRASTISNASTVESYVSTSFVQDTPAPGNASKQRKGGEPELMSASQSSQGCVEDRQISRRRASAVIVDDTESQLDQAEAAGMEDGASVGATPEKQLLREHSNAAGERPILTPRSILGRLRDALSDFRGMMLGSQEEREFDDVLFEMRREVHEAGRRGRE